MTQSELKEILFYDPVSGDFTWIKPASRNIKPGMKAGSVNSTGYLNIMINKKSYKAHRLAWLYVNGRFPLELIDHIDGNKINNSIVNLRELTNSENLQNIMKPKKKNKLGVLGVCSLGKKYTSKITINRKVIRLGVFNTKEEAHAAYLKAKREHHPCSTI